MKRFVLPALLVATMHAQTSAPAPITLTGCVMQTEAGDYTFCEPNSCSLLSGTMLTASLAGHTVTLRAILHLATATDPRTLSVISITTIGPTCDQRCSPRPPGHRGLGSKNNKPGSEGGTPGATSPQDPR